MKILRIDSATTGNNSVSRVLTQAIADHYKAKYPDAEFIVRDLESDPLPHLTNASTGAIRLPEEEHDEAMKAVFPAERAVLDEFLSSDIVIIGAPMYNFTIPSQLKAYLDRLGVPGVTFSYSEAGPEGKAGGRKVVVASSTGGEYEIGGPAEHSNTLLQTILGFIGIDDLTFIKADKIGYGPEARDASIAAAKEEIAKL